MPLWFFPALIGVFAVVSLLAGIWLLLHLRDVAAVFAKRHTSDFVRGPGKRRASRGAVWVAIFIFNFGWIAALAIWIIVIGGDANVVTDATV